jgi:hypothetical protein
MFDDADYCGACVDYWNWRIVLIHSTGTYTFISGDSVYGHNNCSWTVGIGAIPEGYAWTRNINGSIIGQVLVNAKDNNKNVYSAIKNISLVERTSGINRILYQGPIHYRLYQNFPNPFNPSTIITFSISKGTYVKLKIFNTLGQEVAKLMSQHLSAGTYTSEWDAAGSQSGVYYYQIEAGNYIETKKMLLVK